MSEQLLLITYLIGCVTAAIFITNMHYDRYEITVRSLLFILICSSLSWVVAGPFLVILLFREELQRQFLNLSKGGQVYVGEPNPNIDPPEFDIVSEGYNPDNIKR